MRPGYAAPLLVALLVTAGCSEAPQAAAPPAGRERVVTLAPNLAELVFAAGAGGSLVGVSAWSDYPAEVLELPVVGDAFMIDQEQLALLEPDLLLVWQGGTPAHVVDELRGAGYNVEVMRTNSLADVADAILRIGELTGHLDTASRAVEDYRGQIRKLADEHDERDDIRVFYQVSRRPLFTVNGDHYISELIELCGGSNVFADLGELAPTIDVEAVVARDPEVMMASTDAGDDAFAEWDRWPDMAANRLGNRMLMPADEIGRATPRLVRAARSVCDALQEARGKRGPQ